MSFEQGGLSVHDLLKRFGGFTALDHISLEVSPGEALGLVGPNGSGKSTLINVASGVYQHDGGKLFLNGKEMSRIPIHERVHLGINRTFQVPKPFGGLSVLDNVRVAAGYGGHGQRLPMEVLEQLSLADLAQREASTLNTSQQKLLDLAQGPSYSPAGPAH